VHVCLIDDTDKNDVIAFLITAIQLNYCNSIIRGHALTFVALGGRADAFDVGINFVVTFPSRE